MGDRKKEIRLEAVLVNPLNRHLNQPIDFLVDTGASITVIPKKIADKLKLKKCGEATIGLADGRTVKHDLAYVHIFIENHGITTFVTINPDGGALLGFDVMEMLQFQIDVANKRVLKPIRRVKAIKIFLRMEGKRACGILSNKH